MLYGDPSLTQAVLDLTAGRSLVDTFSVIFIAIKTCVAKSIASCLMLFRVSFVFGLEKVSTNERPALHVADMADVKLTFGKSGPHTPNLFHAWGRAT